MSIFHLAFNVGSLDGARAFYGALLGCAEGRATETWVDFDFFGHQISLHLGAPFDHHPTGRVGDHLVPMPHFGVLLEMAAWRALADRLEAAKTDFIIAPHDPLCRGAGGAGDDVPAGPVRQSTGIQRDARPCRRRFRDMTTILFAARPDRWSDYRDCLPAALVDAGLDARIVQFEQDHDPADIDWIIYAPNAALQDFAPYRALKGVLNLWAGVEAVEGNRSLTAPLARMVDPDLTQGMVEWVTGHVLRHHLGMDAHIVNSGAKWDATAPPLARERPVTIMGLGELGAACARALVALGFPVTGWSRSGRDIPGVASVTGEPEDALATGQITVLLVPHTKSTENLIDARRLAAMPRGATLINPGRGPLVVDADLLAALDTGQIGHATLDTFRTEPLPPDHPYWTHPRVTVTPHIASATRPASASKVLAENIRRGEAGEPLLHLVDRSEALT